jgi:hypothetical protein
MERWMKAVLTLCALAALVTALAVAPPAGAVPATSCRQAGPVLSTGDCGPSDDATLVLCRGRDGATTTARPGSCARGEEQLARVALPGTVGAIPTAGDLASFGSRHDPGGINRCGQAACLCEGSFCADLIEAGYCQDFHCAPGRCLCVF